MNKKISLHSLNITNITSVEKYLSDMAAKGWMIKSIILGTVFIFERSEKRDLEFSITPYEIESAFNRKSKEEIEEFRDVTRSVGWEFAAKSFDLHIYYKEASEDLVALQTDEEEKFHAIKKIAKKELLSAYIWTPMLLIFLWFNAGILFSIEGLVTDIYLFIVPMLIVGIISTIMQIVVYKRFLRKNKKNIELGNDIEYTKSNLFGKYSSIMIPSLLGLVSLFVLYMIYKAIRYQDIILFFAFVPGLIGLVIGLLYKYKIKPKGISKRAKMIFFIGSLILAVVVSSAVIFTNVSKFSSDDKVNKNYTYREASSILVPKSYNYYTHGIDPVEIKYFDAFNEGIAKKLVDLLIKQRKNSMVGSYTFALEGLVEGEDVEEEAYESLDLSEDEYRDLKSSDDPDKKIEDITQEMIDKSIVKTEDNIWDADEVYYLSIKKRIALIRWEDEVYYIEGMDFSDEKIIEEVKKEIGKKDESKH